MPTSLWSWTQAISRVATALLVVATLLLLGGTVPARAETPAPAGTEQDAQATELLLRMADYLAKAERFSVTVRSGYDAIQEDGERIEFGAASHVQLQRPERLRVDFNRSDGEQGMMLFDGKEITVFKAGDNVYAKTEKPGTVDGALVYLVRDLELTLPLARMFHTKLPQQLEKLAQSVDYVETDALFDVPVDHLSVRAAEVDCQFWIAQGEQPLPRRIVITYKEAPGQPQFWANFSDWNMAPDVSPDRFAFTPPTGAEKVPFIIRAREPGQATPKEGGAK